MKLKIGKDYLLPNTLYPDDRSKDRRVRITGMDRKPAMSEILADTATST